MTEKEFTSLIDRSAIDEFLKEELDYDLDFFIRMFEIFQGFVNEFSELGRDSKRDDIKLMAHKMRASCRSFGAYELEKKLHHIEYGNESLECLEEAQGLAQGTAQAIRFYYDKKLQEAQKGA